MGYPVGKLSSKYSKPNGLFLVQSKWESFDFYRVTPPQAFTYFQLCSFLIGDHVEAGLEDFGISLFVMGCISLITKCGSVEVIP